MVFFLHLYMELLPEKVYVMYLGYLTRVKSTRHQSLWFFFGCLFVFYLKAGQEKFLNNPVVIKKSNALARKMKNKYIACVSRRAVKSLSNHFIWLKKKKHRSTYTSSCLYTLCLCAYWMWLESSTRVGWHIADIPLKQMVFIVNIHNENVTCFLICKRDMR